MLIWALGSEANFTISLTHTPTTSVLTTINPRTRRIVHQRSVGFASGMVVSGGGAYLGSRSGRILRLVPHERVRVLPRSTGTILLAATSQALWAGSAHRLLRIGLRVR